jgi:cell division protein ZapA
MSERNTVAVKIYGQEYNISAEMPREYIMKLADFVDGRMHEIGDGTQISTSGVAVLAMVNLADDYFNNLKDHDDMAQENEKLKQDALRYEALWEDVKQSFAQYKQEMSAAVSERDDLRAGSDEKDKQFAEVYNELSEAKKYNEVLRGRVAELTAKLQEADAAPQEAQKRIAELEAKCRDTESSFFDIQMDNIHLKNELDSLKRQLGR